MSIHITIVCSKNHFNCISRYGKEGGGFDLDDLDEDFDDLGIGSDDEDQSGEDEEDQEE